MTLPKGFPAGFTVYQTESEDGAVQSYSAMELRAGWGAAVPTLLRKSAAGNPTRS